MTVLVHTKEGLVDRAELEARDIITEDGNSRCIATEWYRDGRLVRRDAAISLLRFTEALGHVNGG